MTPKSFFNIILKIFGLFFLREIINSIPQIISGLILLFTPEQFTEGLILISGAALVLVFYIIMTYQLLFKTKVWVRRLKLDRDFNDEIFSFKIPIENVFKISIIITAAIILLKEIPYLFNDLFSIIQERKYSKGITKPDYSYVIISVVKIILAALLIGERKRIVEFMIAKSSAPETNEMDN
jgi:hypothetical protein